MTVPVCWTHSKTRKYRYLLSDSAIRPIPRSFLSNAAPGKLRHSCVTLPAIWSKPDSTNRNWSSWPKKPAAFMCAAPSPIPDSTRSASGSKIWFPKTWIKASVPGRSKGYIIRWRRHWRCCWPGSFSPNGKIRQYAPAKRCCCCCCRACWLPPPAQKPRTAMPPPWQMPHSRPIAPMKRLPLSRIKNPLRTSRQYCPARSRLIMKGMTCS